MGTGVRPTLSAPLSRRTLLRGLAGGAGALALSGAAAGCGGDSGGGSGELTVLTHWNSPTQQPAMKKLLEEFTSKNQGLATRHQAVAFDQLLQRITADRASGTAADLIHVYSLWLPDLVLGGALDEPPDDVVADVRDNYTQASTQAVSVDDRIWGYPTELDVYQLLYNKKHFQEAGVAAPPATLDELPEVAAKLTRRSGGKITRAGFLAVPGWDSGVVHPFVSMLWSSGGEYLDEAGRKALFASPEGVRVLETYTRMVRDKSFDLTRTQEDFLKGAGSMVIMANFWRNDLKQLFKDGYENIGVAPIPTGPGGTSTPLQYNWMWAVSATTKDREGAWKLARWLNQADGGAPSPTARFFAEQLSAIPSRTADQELLLPDTYNDEFMKTYIAAAEHARPEQPIPGAQEVKTALQQGVESAWFGKAQPEQALADAAAKADEILARTSK